MENVNSTRTNFCDLKQKEEKQGKEVPQRQGGFLNVLVKSLLNILYEATKFRHRALQFRSGICVAFPKCAKHHVGKTTDPCALKFHFLE